MNTKIKLIKREKVFFVVGLLRGNPTCCYVNCFTKTSVGFFGERINQVLLPRVF